MRFDEVNLKNQTPPANVNGQNRKKEKFVNQLIFSRGRRHLRPKKGEILSQPQTEKKKINEKRRGVCDFPFSSRLHKLYNCARAPTRIYCKSVYIKIPR